MIHVDISVAPICPGRKDVFNSCCIMAVEGPLCDGEGDSTNNINLDFCESKVNTRHANSRGVDVEIRIGTGTSRGTVEGFGHQNLLVHESPSIDEEFRSATGVDKIKGKAVTQFCFASSTTTTITAVVPRLCLF